MEKNLLITLYVFLLVGIIVFLILVFVKPQQIDRELAKCIGENSLLYVNEGCSHCIRQTDLFGDNKDLLNIIDCTENATFCYYGNITIVPSWIIYKGNNPTIYAGYKDINELKKITGCQNSNIITGVIH